MHNSSWFGIAVFMRQINSEHYFKSVVKLKENVLLKGIWYINK